MCYRFVLICLVEATHAQNFYHSLQEWIEGAPLCASKHSSVLEDQKEEERESESDTLMHSLTHLHTVNVRIRALRLNMTSVPKGMVRLIPILNRCWHV